MVRTKKWQSEPCGLNVTISASFDWSVAIFTTSLESQESYLTLRNLTLQITWDFFNLHSTFARLYNANASPALHLRSAGSLAITYAWLLKPSSLLLYFYTANSTASRHLKISQSSLLLEFLFSLMRDWSLQAMTWIMIIVAVFTYKSHKQKSIKVSLIRLLNRHLFMKVRDQKLLPILCRKYEFYAEVYAEVYAVDVEEGTQDMLTKSSGWFLEVFSPAKKWLFSFGSVDVSKRPYLATDITVSNQGTYFAKCLDW